MKKIKVNVCPEQYGDYGDGTMVNSILNGKLAFELEITTESQRLTQIFSLDEIYLLETEIKKAIVEREHGLKLKKVTRTEEYFTPGYPELISSTANAEEFLVSFEPDQEDIKHSNNIDMVNPKVSISRNISKDGRSISLEYLDEKGEEYEEFALDKSLPADYDLDILKNVVGKKDLKLKGIEEKVAVKRLKYKQDKINKFPDLLPNEEESPASKDIDIANTGMSISRTKIDSKKNIVVNSIGNREEISNETSISPDYDMEILKKALI